MIVILKEQRKSEQTELLRVLEIVEDVKRVQEPYKKANRKFHPKDTVVRIGDAEIGGGPQSLTPDAFAELAKKVNAVRASLALNG